MDLRVSISHWLPVITFCPVNRLPDFLYITVTFENEFQELYAIRKRIRKVASWKLKFMEDIAADLRKEFPSAVNIKVQLIFGRHVILAK